MSPFPVNLAPLKFSSLDNLLVLEWHELIKEFTKRGGRQNLRTKRTLVSVGKGGVWGGYDPSKVEKKINFQSQFVRFCAFFFLPEAPTQSQAPYFCKKKNRERGAACARFKSAPEWHLSRCIDLPIFSLFWPLLSFSIFPLFSFLSLLSPFLFSSLIFWRPFSDPGGRGPQPTRPSRL